MYRYFKKVSGVCSGSYIYFWKSEGLSDERSNSITASNYGITPDLSHYGTKARVNSVEAVLIKIKLHIIMEQ